MKRWFSFILLSLLAIVLISLFWMIRQTKDRFPDYEVNLSIASHNSSNYLQVGFSKTHITPEIPDTWTDVNGDAVYDPEDGDTYEDRNGNGRFDTQWIAGFGQRRAAMGVHDSLWARAMVIDDGQTRMAIVAIDAIGFGHDDVIRVRQQIPEEAGITYATLTSTHVHQAPDLVGMWGKSPFKSGVDPAYKSLVISQAARAIVQAASLLEPARLQLSQDLDGAADLVVDTRDPQVRDHGLRMIQVIGEKEQKTLGTLVSWANHPETIWSDNLWLSSDFPHYLREGIEKGVYAGDSLIHPGIGGISLFVNGAIGGLMTTHPTTPISALLEDTVYLEPSFDKAEAQGMRLAWMALEAMQDSNKVDTLSQAGISLMAKTLDLPLSNQLFRLATGLGIIDRGMSKWMHFRTEIAVWNLGPIACIQMPGEVYPELLYGGIESPPGQDFEIDPVEIPPLATLLSGDFPLVIGLANDLIGYIIPKSEWDEEPPYLYGADHAHYGEVNSVGPETAPLLHREVKVLLEQVSGISNPR